MYERTKRKQELTEIIKVFKNKVVSEGHEIVTPPNMEDKILDNYEILLNKGLRNVHEDGININIFKVASATEITVNYLQLIKSNSPKLSIFLNAHLASDIAFSLIFSKNLDDNSILLSESEKKLLKIHVEWLMYNNPADFYDFSILGNSTFWEAFYTCVYKL